MVVHDPAYVAAVRSGVPRDLAELNGFLWTPPVDHDARLQRGCRGGGPPRARRRRRGSLSSGLHHARRSRGEGFCTFNGLALAARKAIDGGARAVLIVDPDAHCGGGTAELLADDPAVAQVDLAVVAFDWYRERGRFTLDVIEDAADYLPTLRRRLDALSTLGVRSRALQRRDGPFEQCLIGGLSGITGHLEEREETVFGWCRANDLPVAFVLAGGYALAVSCGRNLSIFTASRSPPRHGRPDSLGSCLTLISAPVGACVDRGLFRPRVSAVP